MAMEYRQLGRSGLMVSPICLGAMMFGGDTDFPTSHRIIDRAYEQGVNFIDTADVYANGQSEVVIGEATKANRDRWVIATKVLNPQGPSPNDRGSSRKYLMQSVEACLKRLATDYIDIFYIHNEDRVTPFDETVMAMADLVRAGKIRYYAFSNHRAWKLAEFSRTADHLGVPRPVCSQPLYNLANRQIEFEHLDTCAYYGLGVVSYSPLARGVLTAKYAPDEKPPEGSRAARGDRRIMQTEWRRESIDLAQRVKDHAAARGTTPVHFALAWVLNNSLISSTIAGPRTEAQWEDYLPALSFAFTAEDEAFINGLVRPGHSSTPGYTDPSHFFSGRRPRVG